MTYSKYLIFGGTSGIGKKISLNLLSKESSIVTISSRRNPRIINSKSTHISLDLSLGVNELEATFNSF